MTKIPADLKYAKSHEWVRIIGGTAAVGITDHAQHELTDIVFVELPERGRKLTAGEACAVVESVKTASDIYSPVSGEGWFFKLKLDAPADAAGLLAASEYKALVGE